MTLVSFSFKTKYTGGNDTGGKNVKKIIAKPKLILLFIAMLVIVGTLSFFQLPQKEIPSTNPPVGQVTTVYPGASAEEVETTVTNQLEEELDNESATASISSVSSPGLSSITVELDESTENPEQVWNSLEQRLSQVSTSFPDDAEEPSINSELSQQGLAIYQLTVEEEAVPEAVQLIENWEQRFTGLPDIDSLEITGDVERELQVRLDSEALEEEGLQSGQVIGALSSASEVIPPGEWQRDGELYQVELEALENVEDWENIEISTGQQSNGESTMLGDVATVENTYASIEEQVEYNQQSALSVTFFLAENASVPQAQSNLDEVIADFKQQLPEGMELTQLYTQGDVVDDLFSSLAISFVVAFVSVLIVCSIGLRLRTALSVAISIPAALAIGMIPLPFTDVGLNQISLIAFIISLGILVDDAIVVNDNIDRRLRMGDSPIDAASNGVREVLVSVIVSTLAVVFTFFPLLFLPGAAGSFIRPLPVVLITVLISSTLLAIFFIPIYRGIVEKRRKKKDRRPSPGFLGSFLDRSASWYSKRVLTRVVKRPVIVSLTGLILGMSAFALVPYTPLEFFPDTEREEVFIEASVPENTPLEETEAEAEEVSSWLQEREGVTSVSSYAGTEIPTVFSGGSGGGAAGSNDMNFLVYVNSEEIPARQGSEIWPKEIRDTFDNVEAQGSIVESGPPVGAPIAVELSGEETDELFSAAAEVESLFAETEGVDLAVSNANQNVNQWQFERDGEALEGTGVTNEAISTELRLLGEGLPFGQWNENNEIVPVQIMYDNGEQVTNNDLDQIVMARDEGGEAVTLSDLGEGVEETTTSAIPHENTERTITVRAYPGDASEDEILEAAGDSLDSIENEYGGVNVQVGGETSERNDVFIDIGQIFIVVVFLLLILFALQFYSLRIPFIVLSAVYVAIAGVILGLFLTQTGLGFMSMMGAVSLAGIVVRNAVVMIEFMEQRIRSGEGVKEAVVAAGEARFRPILLTSLTSIAGLLPIALGDNPLFQPLGTAIVTGLVFSTILTLLLVPALYTWKTESDQKRRARKSKK